MPRIRLRELEMARTNPKAFRQSLSAAAGGGFFRYSYFNALRDAISRYHKNDAATEARDDLIKRLEAKFKSRPRIEETLDRFDWYVKDYTSRGSSGFESRFNLSVQLPSFMPTDLTCGGQVSRIDLVTAGGFAAWIFRNDSIDGWEEELQAPLIQKEVADSLGAKWSEVSVGVYCFPEQTVEWRTYSDKEIRSARRDLSRLFRAMGY